MDHVYFYYRNAFWHVSARYRDGRNAEKEMEKNLYLLTAEIIKRLILLAVRVRFWGYRDRTIWFPF